MDEVLMVPMQEFKRLQDYYKGQITENALLNKAGRRRASHLERQTDSGQCRHENGQTSLV